MASNPESSGSFLFGSQTKPLSMNKMERISEQLVTCFSREFIETIAVTSENFISRLKFYIGKNYSNVTIVHWFSIAYE